MKRPVPPSAVRNRVREYAKQPTPTTMDKRLIGALVGNLNRALGGDENRYLVLGWLFTPEPDKMGFEPIRSEGMTPQMWNGIEKWIGSTKNPETDKWEVNKDFPAEALWVFNLAKWEHGNPEALSPATIDPEFKKAFEALGGEVTMVSPREIKIRPD